MSTTPRNPDPERPDDFEEPAGATAPAPDAEPLRPTFSDPAGSSGGHADQPGTPPPYPQGPPPEPGSVPAPPGGAEPSWDPAAEFGVPPAGGPSQPPFGAPPSQPPFGAPPVSDRFRAEPRPGQVGPHGLTPNEERVHALTAHWLPIVSGFIAPLAFYLADGPWSPYVKENARRSLNFELTLLIGYLISGLLMLAFIGFVLYGLVWVFGIVFHILAATAANRGELYKYPFSFEFVK